MFLRAVGFLVRFLHGLQEQAQTDLQHLEPLRAHDLAEADLQPAIIEQQLLLQAQNMRSELSGVDINTEAVKLLQLQKGFQAAGQVMSVLNSMTETLISMMR